MATYAVTQGSVVINVVVWDGVAPWTPPAGASVLPAPAGCDTTWSVVGGVLTPPPISIVTVTLPDPSQFSNLPKQLQALLLAASALPVSANAAQVAAAFAAAYKGLP